MDTKRYFKALQRQGVRANLRDDGFWAFEAEDGAKIRALFPSDGPIEAKAVEQALAFARARPAPEIADASGKDAGSASARSPGASALGEADLRLDAEGEPFAEVSLAPDAHPGSSGTPVGLTARTRGFWLPSAIGTDINCGMRLFALDGVSAAELRERLPALREPLRQAFCDARRDLPASPEDFQALFEETPGAFARRLRARREGDWRHLSESMERFEENLDLSGVGSGSFLAPPWLVDRSRSAVRDPSLGTLGSGNHFLELGEVEEGCSGDARRLGLRPGMATALLHTGSREVGFHVGSRLMDWARESWPQGVAWPEAGHFPLAGPDAKRALGALGAAARFAWANRLALGALLSRALSEGLGREVGVRPLADCAHNMAFEEDGCFVHRKGAQRARAGDLAIVPGSMGDRSYLGRALGSEAALCSCSHGAGRALSRGAAAHGKGLRQAPFATQAVANDSRRIREEAPAAYKDIEAVMKAQNETGVVDSIASLRPILSVKA
jgi:tRNA-splicing ligase RtcB (3'-phosphate/5'-hydroxy nucleic acid ligase)